MHGYGLEIEPFQLISTVRSLLQSNKTSQK